MGDQTISEYTRRNLFDHLTLSEINWSGPMSESDFLERIFRISQLGNHDSRASSMLGDVALYRENFYDWGGPEWVYTDSRLDLSGCPDAKLLEFLAFMVHPLVRPDQEEVDQLVKTINGFLIRDGYQLEVASVVSEKRIFAAVTVAAQHAADTKDAARIGVSRMLQLPLPTGDQCVIAFWILFAVDAIFALGVVARYFGVAGIPDGTVSISLTRYNLSLWRSVDPLPFR